MEVNINSVDLLKVLVNKNATHAVNVLLQQYCYIYMNVLHNTAFIEIATCRNYIPMFCILYRFGFRVSRLALFHTIVNKNFVLLKLILSELHVDCNNDVYNTLHVASTDHYSWDDTLTEIVGTRV